MKTNFTRSLRKLCFFAISIVALSSMLSSHATAQKWSGTNGNEWLDGKYDQPWVRIGVSTKGIQSVPVNNLPADFKALYLAALKSRIALFHRGVEVRIIKADDTEIVFFGVKNDGSSDELLYRLPTSRRNKYFSTFSDDGSYLLTINSTDDGLRAQSLAPAVSADAVTLTSHKKTDIKTFENEYSHSTIVTYRPAYLNSYFEDGKQGTGTALYQEVNPAINTKNPKSVLYTNSYIATPFNFVVRTPAGTGEIKMTVRLKGRYGNTNAITYAGKDETIANLHQKTTVATSNFDDYETSFTLDNADYNLTTGAGFLGFKSVKTGVSGSGYSVSYYILEYDQLLNNNNFTANQFVFPATASGSQSKIAITNTPTGTKVYDVSNPDAPAIYTPSTTGVSPAITSTLYANRDDQALTLWLTNTPVVVASGKITTASFTELNPSDYDYLIISGDLLTTSASAYAEYRRTESPGKKYKPLMIKMTDVYNQFNYGEPSPVAIRRFVDYMISDGDKDKFLLLIGRSITYFEKSAKELVGQVPTVGFPGSDLLLVDGLKGTQDDVPTIPVGRISASDDSQVMDYLAKITNYERQTTVAWRKKVIHMNGGKSTIEINQFANYLSTIGTSITSAPFSGPTIILKKKTQAADVIEETSLSSDVNPGVGMISYFGHGNVDKTDYNAGYATDPGKAYDNPDNYPVLFYNGCGVNNIFSGREGIYSATDARPMSLDWLLAPNKGAIVVFGNTWDAFATNSNDYLDKLYPQIFGKSDIERKTIGQILRDVAQITKTEKGYNYNAGQNSRTMAGNYDIDRANIHQVLLQGDPALRILITEGSLPVKMISFDAKSELDKVNLIWKTASETNNGRFDIERSYNARTFEKIGSVEGKGTTQVESAYSFYDIKPLTGVSYYRLKQVDSQTNSDGKILEGASTYSKIVSVSRDVDNFLIISPNPTADFADIKLDAPVKIASWTLIDVQGRARKNGHSESEVNLSNLPVGDYVLKITTANGDVYNKKIVKK